MCRVAQLRKCCNEREGSLLASSCCASSKGLTVRPRPFLTMRLGICAKCQTSSPNHKRRPVVAKAWAPPCRFSNMFKDFTRRHPSLCCLVFTCAFFGPGFLDDEFKSWSLWPQLRACSLSVRCGGRAGGWLLQSNGADHRGRAFKFRFGVC